jgi:uncharacterized damage-inducible protein DinB
VDERFPIGRFQVPDQVAAVDRARWLDALREAPRALRTAVTGLTPRQLDTPYREGGWTIRQLVHHVADSHMNAYVRFKLALTEDGPTVKAYDEAAWAELPDASMPVEVSLDLLDALHARWVELLERLDEPAWRRSFVHPESGASVPLVRNLALYAWHGAHHTAHVSRLRERNGW